MSEQNRSISIYLVRILIRFMAKNGIDLQHSLEEAAIDPLMLKDNAARISVLQFYNIWKIAVRKNNDANMGLHFGREIGNTYFKANLLFGMMAGAGTVKNALALFCRYHALSEDAMLPDIKIKKDLAFLSWKTPSPDLYFTRQISEALLCAYARILRNIADNNPNLLEVRFRHGPPPDIQEHQDIFMARLRFNQPENEIVLHRSELDQPVFFDDPGLVQTLSDLSEKKLDQLYDSTLWTARVRGLIRKNLVLGKKTDINTISSILAVSPRNLQSRLQGENATFQKILDQERLETASRYLSQKKMPICDIALLLGFSEQSAFNHAFRRCTGLTPGQYRKKP